MNKIQEKILKLLVKQQLWYYNKFSRVLNFMKLSLIIQLNNLLSSYAENTGYHWIIEVKQYNIVKWCDRDLKHEKYENDFNNKEK